MAGVDAAAFGVTGGGIDKTLQVQNAFNAAGAIKSYVDFGTMKDIKLTGTIDCKEAGFSFVGA